MTKVNDYTATFLVDQSPQEVFNAVINPRGWWSEDIEGNTDKLGSVFYHSFKDVHRCTLKITEFIPGKKVVWHVLQNYFNFIKDPTEWTGTDIVFEVRKQGDKTELRFTHIGLNSTEECYGVCHDAWGFYIKRSLRDLITDGKGEPNKKDTVSENNPVKK